MRPFCDLPVALILSSLYNQFWLQNNKFCLYRNSNAEGSSCSPASPSQPVKHSLRKRWIPGLITEPHIWAARRPYSGLWISYELLYVPCVMYMHTPILNETFLCTLHTCGRCSVSYDTSTYGMGAGAALARGSEYVFHSKENKELSRALDLLGFHWCSLFSKIYPNFKFFNIRKWKQWLDHNLHKWNEHSI